MKVKQISVMVANEGGRLAETASFLGKNNINLRALSIADTQSFGILRIIVDNPEEAKSLLEKAGFVVKMNEVLAVSVADKPGGLAETVNKLSSAGVGIEYAYAFPSSVPGNAYLIFRVDDNEKAEKVIGSDDFKL